MKLFADIRSTIFQMWRNIIDGQETIIFWKYLPFADKQNVLAGIGHVSM